MLSVDADVVLGVIPASWMCTRAVHILAMHLRTFDLKAARSLPRAEPACSMVDKDRSSCVWGRSGWMRASLTALRCERMLLVGGAEYLRPL